MGAGASTGLATATAESSVDDLKKAFEGVPEEARTRLLQALEETKSAETEEKVEPAKEAQLTSRSETPLDGKDPDAGGKSAESGMAEKPAEPDKAEEPVLPAFDPAKKPAPSLMGD